MCAYTERQTTIAQSVFEPTAKCIRFCCACVKIVLLGTLKKRDKWKYSAYNPRMKARDFALLKAHCCYPRAYLVLRMNY